MGKESLSLYVPCTQIQWIVLLSAAKNSYCTYPFNLSNPSPVKSEKLLIVEWKKAGPRPHPLPPPPSRPFYQHEKEGWHRWVAQTDKEPDPSPLDLRMQAHSLLWDAVDYHISVEADAFFPCFHNDGSGWPDFSSLVMGQRLYQMASRITYRPDR